MLGKIIDNHAAQERNGGLLIPRSMLGIFGEEGEDDRQSTVFPSSYLPSFSSSRSLNHHQRLWSPARSLCHRAILPRQTQSLLSHADLEIPQFSYRTTASKPNSPKNIQHSPRTITKTNCKLRSATATATEVPGLLSFRY